MIAIDMEMPNACRSCKFNDESRYHNRPVCELTGKDSLTFERREDCPLTPPLNLHGKVKGVDLYEVGK